MTAEGERQVESTARQLVGPRKLIDPDRLAHIWVSPRKRAKRTFDLLFGDGGPAITSDKVTITEDIAEWDYGDYEGLVVEEIIRRRKAKGLDPDRKYSVWRDGCEGGEYVILLFLVSICCLICLWKAADFFSKRSPRQVADRLDQLITQIKKIHEPHMNGDKPVDVVLV